MSRVDLAQGPVQGQLCDGVHSFMGIPYAASVSGVNRWRPPQAPETWSEVRDATRPGRVCHQPVIQTPAWLVGRAAGVYMTLANNSEPQGDDCLNLNIWTPAPDHEAGLPVMFWIHGGGSIQGSGSMPSYEGSALARKGVVVVTINYRLGLAGFLAAPDAFDGDVGTPNRGFLDQIQALEWVRDNIERFGGDPAKVTIFGESAGGVSVSALLGSPQSTGLYQRAIVMSGAVESGAPLVDHQALASDFFARVGIAKGDTNALSTFTGEQLVELYDVVEKMAKNSGGKYGEMSKGFGGAPNAFHTAFHPVPTLDAIAAGQIRNIDLMLGTCRDESRLFSLLLPGPARLGSRLALKEFAPFYSAGRTARELVREYRKLMPDVSRHFVREQVVGDAMFRRGTVRAAEAHAATNQGNTYLYQFEWETPAMSGAFGAVHGLELAMIFQTMENAPELYPDIDSARAFSEQLTNAWTNFAKYGKPSAAGLPEWEAFEAGNRASMTLNTRSEIRYGTDADKLEIWGERNPGQAI